MSEGKLASAFPDDSFSVQSVDGARDLKVLVHFPYENPYGSLLYDAIREQRPDADMAFTNGRGGRRYEVLAFPIRAVRRRLAGYRIVHIHWPDFRLAQRVPLHRQIGLAWFYVCFWTLRLLGYRIVWTVHNVIPHEPQTSNDSRISRMMAAKADIKIVHSAQTIAKLQELGLNPDRVVVIPHGNYESSFGEVTERGEARMRLGLAGHEFVILFFGLVRPYKGVPDLLRVIPQVRVPHARLVIAGACTDRALREEIAELADDRVVLALEYIDEKDVPVYFGAADVVCLPFRSMTTSGSLLLALTFGKPVVAPMLGNVAELPDNVGWFYDPDDSSGLQRSLENAAADPVTLREYGAAATRYSSGASWPEIARQTLAVYDRLRSPSSSVG